MTNRQPKGTPIGGQFAEGRKPEGVDLHNSGNALSIGDSVFHNGVQGTVVDVQPATMHPTGEATLDVQVDFSGTYGGPDFDPDAIGCPWFDISELTTAPSTERKKMRVTNSRGNEFEIRIIRKGERYGRDDCLVNDESNKFFNPKDPILVEFWDAEQDPDHFPGGCQFVSRYGIRTLTDRSDAHTHAGLNLYGGEPKWSIDADTMSTVYEWLTPVLGEIEQTEES